MGFGGVRGGGESGGGRRREKRDVELFVVLFLGVEAFKVGSMSGGGGGDGEVVEEKREEGEKGNKVNMRIAATGYEKRERGRNHQERRV